MSSWALWWACNHANCPSVGVRIRVRLSGCSLGPCLWLQFRAGWSCLGCFVFGFFGFGGVLFVCFVFLLFLHVHLESFSFTDLVHPDFILRMFALCTQSSVQFSQYLSSASVLFFVITVLAFLALSFSVSFFSPFCHLVSVCAPLFFLNRSFEWILPTGEDRVCLQNNRRRWEGHLALNTPKFISFKGSLPTDKG